MSNLLLQKNGILRDAHWLAYSLLLDIQYWRKQAVSRFQVDFKQNRLHDELNKISSWGE